MGVDRGRCRIVLLARNTRPDILQAVIELSRFSQNFTSYLVESLKRVIRYLKGTPKLGITFRRDPSVVSVGNTFPVSFQLFTDSDWARCKATRRSTGGYVLSLFGNLLSCASKRFPTVALSTMEAEYMTLSEAVRALLHFRNMVIEFPDLFTLPRKIPVLCDNKSAIFVADNLVNNSRSKHIDIRYHFVRERVHEGLIEILHVASEDNLADWFTKPLTTEVFVRLRSRIMGH